jgi:hypothetical protein
MLEYVSEMEAVMVPRTIIGQRPQAELRARALPLRLPPWA